MKLVSLLEKDERIIVDEASQALQRSHLKHYDAATDVERRERLQRLYDLTVSCLRERNLVPMLAYSAQIAEERYRAGYSIQEVQVAFNVLEEAMWRHVVAALPPDQLAEGVGLLGTVLGAGKDALARKYVELASAQAAPDLDLSALFGGTAGM